MFGLTRDWIPDVRVDREDGQPILSFPNLKARIYLDAIVSAPSDQNCDGCRSHFCKSGHVTTEHPTSPWSLAHRLVQRQTSLLEAHYLPLPDEIDVPFNSLGAQQSNMFF